MAQETEPSQTAQDFIASQLQLEAEAREALPYQFDTCTQPLGPLRQSLFSCLTCNPPPPSPSSDYTPAGLCYSCSISCHGEHDLVELFTKRNFECDCGTSRIASSAPCTLRPHPTTGEKGAVIGEAPSKENKYNHNFAGRFCGCKDEYDPTKEKGTMFQCLGLGTVEQGGCGEDWWHPECLMGLPRDTPHAKSLNTGKEIKSTTQPQSDVGSAALDHVSTAPGTAPTTAADHDDAPLPPGFPPEDDFDHFICYKCVQANPWINRYAGTPGFLNPVYHKIKSEAASEHNEPDVVTGATRSESPQSNKRKAEDNVDISSTTSKKAKVEDDAEAVPDIESADTTSPKHTSLPAASNQIQSLFLKDDFREHLCRCPECFPKLSKFPQLSEEEESYEPPMSESDAGDDNGGGSVGSGSTYERGEALLSNVDRVRAIEGVMVYNQLRDKIKAFLQPFAESGQAVGAEDIKAYFEKLRGDDEAIKLAAAGVGGSGANDESDSRKEQGGY